MKLHSSTSLIFILALTSIVALLTRNWLAAAAFATMAAGLALTGQAKPTMLAGPTQNTVPSIPTWQRESAMLLVCTAITLFGFQIGQALHQAINHLSR